MVKKIYYVLVFFSLIGLADAGYLAYEHYAKITPPCSIGSLFDCGTVIRSQYAVFLGLPLAIWGVFHYTILFSSSLFYLIYKKQFWMYIFSFFAIVGFLGSLYFVYLQAVVLKAFCFYCLISAANSALIFVLVLIRFFRRSRQNSFSTYRI